MYKEDPELIKKVKVFVEFIIENLHIVNVDNDWKKRTPIGHCFCRYCLQYLMLRSTDFMNHLVLNCQCAPFTAKVSLMEKVSNHSNNSHAKFAALQETIHSHSDGQKVGNGSMGLLKRSVSSESFFNPHLSKAAEISAAKDFAMGVFTTGSSFNLFDNKYIKSGLYKIQPENLKVAFPDEPDGIGFINNHILIYIYNSHYYINNNINLKKGMELTKERYGIADWVFLIEKDDSGESSDVMMTSK